MKPGYEKVLNPLGGSFATQIIERKSRPMLSQAWHFHPEIEICFTTKSHGRRFVGNQISDYQENDLVLLGSKLPHGFTTEERCSQVVIQFNPDFLGNEFINSPELRTIKNLLNDARRGLAFGKETQAKTAELIHQVASSKRLNKLINLLELLEVLTNATDVTAICSEEYALGFDESQMGRIKIVYDHVMDNFTQDVSVKEIAEKLNLSEAGFYKFIKKHTKKTYTQIINEFKINYATKLLMVSDKTITEICFESGFNNLSYFNRKFKVIMNETPQSFKLKYERGNLV